MKTLPQAIALSALVAGATTLEINNYPAHGIWILIVVWVMFS